MPEVIDLYFDPMCPYAYQTSRWIRAVRSQVEVDVTWKFFSLEEVNLVAGKKHPWERPWSYGFGQMRVGALIRRELGNDAVDRWYAAIGHAFFYDGIKTHIPEQHARVIEEVGFDPAYVERAIDDPSTSVEVRDEHLDAVATYGVHGVATIIFPATNYAVYGPVVVPGPEGEEAVALWELVRGMQGFPHLYELRHPKTMDDLVHVGEQFGTYLSTRDWNTVENPAP
jgi:2-hydroxychromene-2-carboxylate isomerase